MNISFNNPSLKDQRQSKFGTFCWEWVSSTVFILFRNLQCKIPKEWPILDPFSKEMKPIMQRREKEIGGSYGSCFGVPSGPSFRGQNCCLSTQMAGTICPLSREGMERALITSSSYSSFKSEKRHFYGVSALMGQVGFNSCLMIWVREGH